MTTEHQIILLHHFKENYTVSYSVMLMYKMFYHIRDHFISKGWKINSMMDYIKDSSDKNKIMGLNENMKLDDGEIKRIYYDAVTNFINEVKLTDKFNGGYAIGFHPIGYDPLFTGENYDILKSKGIKLIIWQDDLHALWRNMNKTWTEDVTDRRYDCADMILSPSKKFYINLNHKYAGKTEQYFYCFNESFYKELPINNFYRRQNKIILSGALGPQYPIRHAFYNYYRMNKGKGLAKYIDILNHPGYDRQKNKHMSGLSYYKHINSYKGAFFGYYVQPMNYPLAKIIEILACGTLGFFEYNRSLDDLGLVKFKHYVPIKMNNLNQPLMDMEYYIYYLQSKKGEEIAREGCKYVRERFTMKNKGDELIEILKKMV